jgi:hypothetical protein
MESPNNIPNVQQLRTARERGILGVLIVALNAAQRQEFFRVVIEQVCAECSRVLPVLAQRRDPCGTEALAAARAWLDHGSWPGDAIQRRFDDFYNPFWLAFSSVSTDQNECATAAAYCCERAVQAAYQNNIYTTTQAATTVVDVVAQAARADHMVARANIERWYCEVAWALFEGSAPPRLPTQPPIKEEV